MTNKKIGLCVCYNTKNYGSMLQTLATCIVIEQMGYDYEIIDYVRKPTIGLVFRSLGRIPEIVEGKIKKNEEANKLKKYPEVKEKIETRNVRFDLFMKTRFTKMSKTVYTFSELTKLAKNYDAVLVGSDQLWRPEGFTTGFYNLLFVPDSIPKISYATSFGVSEIPKFKKKTAKKFLERFASISVREIRGAEIIKDLTGKTVTVTLDPTLLFDSEKWLEVIPDNTIFKEPYVFCYFLGTNVDHRKVAEQLKKESGLNLVTCPLLDNYVEYDLSFGDMQLYDIDAADFVNLIRHAEYVLTDSFHGTVFSILNHKKFMTFSRFSDFSKNSRNSRIYSLLSQTGLENRHFKSQAITDIKELIEKDIDYADVDHRLGLMRKSSMKYLSEALEYLNGN